MSPPPSPPSPPARCHVCRPLLHVAILQHLGVVRHRYVRKAGGFCCSACSIERGGGEICLLLLLLLLLFLLTQASRLFMCKVVPPRVACCVFPSISRIAVRILDRPGRRCFRPPRRMRRRRLIFPSLPSPFPCIIPHMKIACVAVSQWVDCCVAVKPNPIVAAPKDKEEKSDFPFSFFSSSSILLKRQPGR